ncbi:Nucleic-acid-binding protein from transposon X-element [Eumeta japonica]|uniref:Nucleic-acid-binding protein from transposon X-element n=1 Tax=Eumeta variegata TaxID=151549 RepID=A0A4C1XV34_EUMVA|nr:Nucleic-acid-binding protein from transposon X-element [Eumeta japonica]
MWLSVKVCKVITSVTSFLQNTGKQILLLLKLCPQRLKNDPNKNTWQQDRIPQAKRKRVETKSPQTENIKKKSNTSTYAIPTHNQFDILDDEEATTDNKETEKPPKPEPIFVTGVLDINALRNKLKEITTTDDYTMTTLKSGHIVKIMPTNIEIYKSIREKFISDNISHYTYMLKSERPYRVVLRGLHSSEDTTEIKEILKENGHEVRQIVNVRHQTSKEPLPLFYVDLEPKSNNRDIFNLKYLNHMKVTFEPPYKKKKSSSAKGAKGLVIPKSVSQTIQMRQVRRRPPNQHL